jgi:hypothetical protein
MSVSMSVPMSMAVPVSLTHETEATCGSKDLRIYRGRCQDMAAGGIWQVRTLLTGVARAAAGLRP